VKGLALGDEDDDWVRSDRSRPCNAFVSAALVVAPSPPIAREDGVTPLCREMAVRGSTERIG